jgi:RND family efflux transporter MFP subunit
MTIHVDLSGLASQLLTAQDINARSRIVARRLADAAPGSCVTVYLLGSEDDRDLWIPKAGAGDSDVKAHKAAIDAGTLGELASALTPLLFAGPELSRENYAHLDVRKTILAMAYLPLIHGENLIGGIEVLTFQEELTTEDLEELSAAAPIVAAALAAGIAYESERNDSLTSITRLTQLYDLEKMFASTLEMNELLPIIGGKSREVMECEAVNIWLVQPDESLKLMHQAGLDSSTYEDQIQKPGEGIPGDVSDDGIPVLIEEAGDTRLTNRNADAADTQVSSLIAVPIMDRESLVGVVEAINPLDGSAFDEDDLFALTTITETASSALHNASLLMAERKVEILETLVTVSHEITSTLNLERMLQTIVNAPQAVIPYERAAIALEQRGRFKLSAVTGLTQINADSPDLAPLNDVLQWVALSEEIIHVRQHGDQIDTHREETREKFRAYFQESGMRGFYAIPLNDDSGRVGVLALESNDPDFLGPAHIEILQVLAGQATVALRNAQMYKEVPFISVLEPMLDRKRRFMAMEKKRRSLIIGVTVAALVFLAIFPLPMRVDGDAVVAPVHRAQVQPEFEGVVGKVYVREGEAVTRGQVLAQMDAWAYRSTLAEADARYQSALLQMNRSLASNDGSEAGVERVQADYWKAAVERAKQQVDRAELRSPIDGVIATPHVENSAGRHMQYGDTFAEVVDASSAVVDVAVEDSEASLLRAGAKAVVKLNGYATRTFHGNVLVVSPKAEQQGDSRVFFARVAVANPDAAIRTGMEGRGKISVGWYPAGYVLFRKPALWLYSLIWNWFGW